MPSSNYFEERKSYLKESKEYLKSREECKKIMPNASEQTWDSCAQTILLKKILDENLKNLRKL